MNAPIAMPSLARAEWLDSRPLGPEELRGRVVLVNFWTFTCINWLRQLPYVRAWSQAYRDDGLVVIGVHTPEFTFEHDVARVRRAAEERRIEYGIVIDNEYEVWRAFSNHYWPALYFVDRNGSIRDTHFGEGRYAQSERVIQRLLGIDREPVSVTGIGVEAAADWADLQTPETYLGSGRGGGVASQALAGDWRVEQERVVLTKAGGRIAFTFHARDANLVLARGAEPVPFRLLIDGQPPGESHGVDVSADGQGLIDDGRLYQLFRRQGEVGKRTLELTFLAPGAEAYVFTFG
ncbi:redoxin domain-containing protein [Kribbella sp. NPDC049584]|uniref:redoxin domain-containing protein n=1 Tax=Kribbella sp. NPDC049584 TaxID=3154833 RepID=UPI003444CB5F